MNTEQIRDKAEFHSRRSERKSRKINKDSFLEVYQKKAKAKDKKCLINIQNKEQLKHFQSLEQKCRVIMNCNPKTQKEKIVREMAGAFEDQKAKLKSFFKINLIEGHYTNKINSALETHQKNISNNENPHDHHQFQSIHSTREHIITAEELQQHQIHEQSSELYGMGLLPLKKETSYKLLEDNYQKCQLIFGFDKLIPSFREQDDREDDNLGFH